MINQEELAICRQRGHPHLSATLREGWRQCEKCGLWLRKRQILEEREDQPPDEELDVMLRLGRKLGNVAVLPKIDREELAICRRREHEVWCGPSQDWLQCRKCGMWVRIRTELDEREEEP
jgi:hypothetical protein